MAIIFPQNPLLGQEYVGDNAVTYQWMGNRWSTLVPLTAFRSQYVAVAGAADTEYNELFDNTLDGGGA